MKRIAYERGHAYEVNLRPKFDRVNKERQAAELDPTWDERIPFPHGGNDQPTMARGEQQPVLRHSEDKPLPRQRGRFRGTVTLSDRLQTDLGRKGFGQLLDGLSKMTRRPKRRRRGRR